MSSLAESVELKIASYIRYMAVGQNSLGVVAMVFGGISMYLTFLDTFSCPKGLFCTEASGQGFMG